MSTGDIAILVLIAAWAAWSLASVASAGRRSAIALEELVVLVKRWRR